MRTKIIFVGDLQEFFSVRAWEFLDEVQPTLTAATLNGIMFQVSENSCFRIKYCDRFQILSHVRVNSSLLFQLFFRKGKSSEFIIEKLSVMMKRFLKFSQLKRMAIVNLKYNVMLGKFYLVKFFLVWEQKRTRECLSRKGLQIFLEFFQELNKTYSVDSLISK